MQVYVNILIPKSEGGYVRMGRTYFVKGPTDPIIYTIIHPHRIREYFISPSLQVQVIYYNGALGLQSI